MDGSVAKLRSLAWSCRDEASLLALRFEVANVHELVLSDLDADATTGRLLSVALLTDSPAITSIAFVRANFRNPDVVTSFFKAAYAVFRRPSLREVIFERCTIRADSHMAFCAALDQWVVENVEALGLVALPNCVNWSPTLELFCGLRELDLSYSEQPLVAFLQTLFSMPDVELQSLAVCGHTIGKPCVAVLCGPGWPASLTHLDVSSCALDRTHVALLTHLAGALSSLHMGANPALLGAPLAQLCDDSSRALRLTRLSVSGMPISKDDMHALLVLADGKTLRALDLSATRLNKSALAVLLRGLASEQCTLTELDLSANLLHSLANFHELFEVLRSPASLVTRLALAGCGLDKLDVDAVADWLACDPAAQRVDLSDNALGAALLRLPRALGLNATLRELVVLDRSVTRTVWDQFFALLSASGAGLGLRVTALPMGDTARTAPPRTMLLLAGDASPQSLAPAFLDRFTAVCFVDCEAPVSLAHAAIANTRFVQSLRIQRCAALDVGPLPAARLDLLTDLRVVACELGDAELVLLVSHVQQRCPALTTLHLHSNRIANLTPRIGALVALLDFGVRDNLLEELPVQLTALRALNTLDLRFNPLSALPESTAQLADAAAIRQLFAHLEQVASADAVPSPYLRLAVLARSADLVDGVLAELRALADSKGERESASQVSVSGTGKGRATALKKSSLSRSSGAALTVAKSVLTSPPPPGMPVLQQRLYRFGPGAVLDDAPLNVLTWHGDALLRTLPSTMLEKGVVVLVFVASASRSEAEMCKELTGLKKAVGPLHKKVVGLGLVPRDESLARDTVPRWEASLRKSTGVKTFYLRAGHSGAAQLLRALMADASKAKAVGRPVPAVWLQIARGLETGPPIMTLAALVTMAQGYAVADVTPLLRYLDECGLVWALLDRPVLRDFVFVNPARVLQLCCTLAGMFADSGSAGVAFADVSVAWQPLLPRDWHEAVYRLAHELNLMHALPSGRSLVAGALPPAPLGRAVSPRRDAFTDASMGRNYEFGHVREYFFAALAASLQYWPGMAVEQLWAAGAVLTMQTGRVVEQARLLWSAHAHTLSITVHQESLQLSSDAMFAEAQGQMLRAVVETVDAVARGVGTAALDITIPCSHCLNDERLRMAPYCFSYQDVFSALMSNQHAVLCQQLKSRPVLIASLAPDIALTDLAAGRNEIPRSAIELGEMVGKGGFAIVYKALYNGQAVAVKKLNTCTTPEEFAEFQREVWVMAGQNSPFLVYLHGVCFEPDEAPMLVMEYVPHGTLYELLHGQHGTPLLPALRMRIALDVARGMQVLAGSCPPLIHRDLKSPNVLLASLDPLAPQVAKVADFGLAHRLSGQAATGRDVHNPDWLAPEIMLNLPYAASSDVFSFGIIMWELVALQHPYAEFADRFHGFAADEKERAIALEHLRPSVPGATEAWYSQLMQRCWSREPLQRPSFDALVEALGAHCAAVPVAAVPRAMALTEARVARMSRASVVMQMQRERSASESPAAATASAAAMVAVPAAPVPVPEERPVRLLRRIVFPSGVPVQVAVPPAIGGDGGAGSGINGSGGVVSTNDWIYVGLEDGAVAIASARVGGVLSSTEPLGHGRALCMRVVGKTLWLACADARLQSLTTNLMLLESAPSPRGASPCQLLCESHFPHAPIVGAFADGAIVLMSSAFLPVRSFVPAPADAARITALLTVEEHGEVTLFAADNRGQLAVFALPELALRGRLVVSPQAVLCVEHDRVRPAHFARLSLTLSQKNSLLWLGCVGGAIALIRKQGNQLASLAPKHAHSTDVVSLLVFPKIQRLASRSIDGHLCMWNLSDCDLEFEANEAHFANAAPAFPAGATGVLGVCDKRERALCFFSLALEGVAAAEGASSLGVGARPPPPGVAPPAAPVSPRAAAALADRRFSKIDLQQLMKDVSPPMALYISIQQYRQTLDAPWRRALALRIRAEFFPETGPVGVGVSFETARAMRAKLRHLAADESLEAPQNLFDGLASALLETQRHSLTDLTRTVFLDLCAKGIELRAMTYDSVVVQSFVNLCENMDAAAWDTVPCQGKTKQRKVAVKVDALSLKWGNDRDATSKSRIVIERPAAMVLKCVSEPAHKQEWDSSLVQCEVLEQFTEDFFITHNVYMASKLIRNRDAVVACLLSTSGESLLYIARSVPYGSLRSPPGCERLEVDASGYLLRPLSATSCEVTHLLQLREVRNKLPAALFKSIQRKRLASVVRLKEYAEGLPLPGAVTPPHIRVLAAAARASQSSTIHIGHARARSPRSGAAAAAPAPASGGADASEAVPE